MFITFLLDVILADTTWGMILYSLTSLFVNILHELAVTLNTYDQYIGNYLIFDFWKKFTLTFWYTDTSSIISVSSNIFTYPALLVLT
jgi:hypothetical protein